MVLTGVIVIFIGVIMLSTSLIEPYSSTESCTGAGYREVITSTEPNGITTTSTITLPPCGSPPSSADYISTVLLYLGIPTLILGVTIALVGASRLSDAHPQNGRLFLNSYDLPSLQAMFRQKSSLNPQQALKVPLHYSTTVL